MNSTWRKPAKIDSIGKKYGRTDANKCNCSGQHQFYLEMQQILESQTHFSFPEFVSAWKK